MLAELLDTTSLSRRIIHRDRGLNRDCDSFPVVASRRGGGDVSPNIPARGGGLIGFSNYQLPSEYVP